MRRGFTIVELLIVIVVIGILAAVTFVAYSGVQDRARDAKRLAAADAYEKLIRAYKEIEGDYPEVNNPGPHGVVCLGEASNYPARDGFAPGACYQAGNETVIASVNSSLNGKIGLYVSGDLPDASYPPADVLFSGVLYRSRGMIATVDGSGKVVGIGYIVNNNNKPCSGRFKTDIVTMGENAKVCQIMLQ